MFAAVSAAISSLSKTIADEYNTLFKAAHNHGLRSGSLSLRSHTHGHMHTHTDEGVQRRAFLGSVKGSARAEVHRALYFQGDTPRTTVGVCEREACVCLAWVGFRGVAWEGTR